MKERSYKVLNYLDSGIFPATILFSCGFTYKEIEKICKENKAKDWFKAIKEDEQLLETSKYLCMRRVYNKKNYFYIILKERFDFSDESFCILAHEVLHVVQFILDGILDRDREFESEAYLHSHIMKQCLETLRNKTTN